MNDRIQQSEGLTDEMLSAGERAIHSCRVHETSDRKMAAEVWRAMSRPTPIDAGDEELIRQLRDEVRGWLIGGDAPEEYRDVVTRAADRLEQLTGK